MLSCPSCLLRSTEVFLQSGTRWSMASWRTGMTWSASGSTCILKTSSRHSQKRWETTLCNSTGIVQCMCNTRSLGTLGKIWDFSFALLSELDSFTSQEILHKKCPSRIPLQIWWSGLAENLPFTFAIHTLSNYSTLGQVLLIFPVLPAHQAYPLSSGMIWSEEGENHNSVVWKDLTKNIIKCLRAILSCGVGIFLSACAKTICLHPFLGSVYFGWIFVTESHPTCPSWVTVTHRVHFLTLLHN